MKIDITLTGKTLAAATVASLGVILALATTVARGTEAAPANTPALVRAMVEQTDHVQAPELAQWLIEKRTDFQLVDIRLPWQYDDYHLPTAINIPLAALFEPAGLNQLARGKKIVVYGLGAGHAAEAQLLLVMKGYHALSLKEGLTAWWNEVITPVSLRSEDPSPGGYSQAKQLREQFLGGPGGAKPAAAPASPATAPSTPPAGGGGTKKLKLGRGCS
jgi:sulfur-carrier protein adenylyltransferase/sulfurtransferase